RQLVRGRPAPRGVVEGLHDAPVVEAGGVRRLDRLVDPGEVAAGALATGVRVETDVVGGAFPERHLVERVPGEQALEAVRVEDDHGRLGRVDRVDQVAARLVLGRCVRAGVRVRLVRDELAENLGVSNGGLDFFRQGRITHLPGAAAV